MATPVTGARRVGDPATVATTPPPVPTSSPEAGPRRRRVLAPRALLLLPAAVLLAGGWSHRWVDEDGFINFRVVEQLLAGNGPVFNAGERVEAVTSPAWIAVLALGRSTLGLVVDFEWVAVVAGLLVGTAAFVVAGRASRSLHPDAPVVVPLGLGLVAAVPVVWDFTTAGLELSLVWLWLALSWSVLLRAATAVPAGRRRVGSLAVLGFGPLVRPDLVLVSGCLLVAWYLVARPSRRRTLLDLAAALALPVAYEVFRMGYYAALVPNTGLAKGAGDHYLFAGVNYLADLNRPYWLWIAAVPAAVATAGTVVGAGRDRAVACLALLAGGLLHGSYIVYVGGDYMHGRLFLPALFAIALPAVVPLRTWRSLSAPAVAVGVVWAVVCAGWLRYENPEGAASRLLPVSDRRAISDPDGRVAHPRTAALGLAEAHEAGERGVVPGLLPEVLEEDEPLPDIDAEPGGPADELLALSPSVGIFGYHAGTDVWVVDTRGLGDPVVARAAVPAAWAHVAGHRKGVDDEWFHARFGYGPQVVGYGRRPASIAKIEAGRSALRCPPLSDLVDAVSEPLTPGRFLSNVWHSPRLTTLQLEVDPLDAEEALCGG